MTIHDDRVFMRHFSWVLLALVGIVIFFIFLAFLITDESGVNSHTGYTYMKYASQHQPATKQSKSASSPPASSQAAAGATASSTASQSSEVAVNGSKVWHHTCAACHETGVAGAPKIGDTKAWAPILKSTSTHELEQRAIHGYHGKRGVMPAKGGNSSLSDAQVIAAAKYMIDKSKKSH